MEASLLDGRFIRLLLAPAKGPARLFSAGFGIVTSALNKVLGTQVLSDVQTFVAAFDTLFGGFRQRAEATFTLLQAQQTAFIVVAAPEPAAMREAAYFVERLADDDMPLAGLVVNRTSAPEADAISQSAAAAGADALAASEDLDDRHVAGLLSVHAERKSVQKRELRLKRQFASAHPSVPMVSVPALAGDVHDLDGLRQIGELLAGD